MGSLGSSLPSTSLGPSPFQSVPGGSTTSPTESNPTSQVMEQFPMYFITDLISRRWVQTTLKVNIIGWLSP